jgi:3-deoxy-D-manno-octulosonic-acid transferase
MLILYNLFVRSYTLAIRLAAPFNTKARQWIEGRKNWEKKLEEALRPLRSRSLVWIHCASLGEFEQGRPVIEGLRERRPEAAILLTFFSPSGYEIRKNYELADHVAYLPADTPGNARRFVQLVNPALVIFVKYEFWYHHLRGVQQRQTPLLLISAIFHPGQLFFYPGGAPFRRLLQGFDHIFAQNEPSAAMLRQLKITNFTIAGDTRIDRVCQIAEQGRSFPGVDTFSCDHYCLIAGSTWPADEDRLRVLLNEHLPPGWKCILAPHEVDEPHLQRIETQLQLSSVRYSQLQGVDHSKYRVLLIDNIGMLSSLYRYGRLAYIGGGFGTGIHNMLEPLAFGLPVLFGPNYKKFEEARQLVARGGAFPVKTASDILRIFRELQEPSRYRQASREAQQYLENNRGATQQILDYLDEV